MRHSGSRFAFRASAKKTPRNRGEMCALRLARAQAQSGARTAPAQTRARPRALRAVQGPRSRPGKWQHKGNGTQWRKGRRKGGT